MSEISKLEQNIIIKKIDKSTMNISTMHKPTLLVAGRMPRFKPSSATSFNIVLANQRPDCEKKKSFVLLYVLFPVVRFRVRNRCLCSKFTT